MSLNSSQTGQQPEHPFHYGNGKDLVSGAGAPSPSGFFFVSYFYKQVLLLVVGGEGFHDN